MLPTSKDDSRHLQASPSYDAESQRPLITYLININIFAAIISFPINCVKIQIYFLSRKCLFAIERRATVMLRKTFVCSTVPNISENILTFSQ